MSSNNTQAKGLKDLSTAIDKAILSEPIKQKMIWLIIF